MGASPLPVRTLRRGFGLPPNRFPEPTHRSLQLPPSPRQGKSTRAPRCETRCAVPCGAAGGARVLRSRQVAAPFPTAFQWLQDAARGSTLPVPRGGGDEEKKEEEEEEAGDERAVRPRPE